MATIRSAELIQMMQDIALNPDYPPSQRLMAARTLLDKSVPNVTSVTPKQPTTINNLSNLSSPELTALLIELSHDPAGSDGARAGGTDMEAISSDQNMKLSKSEQYAVCKESDEALNGELIPAVPAEEYEIDLPYLDEE